MTLAPEKIVARDEDLQAVRQAVVDYCEGYHTRDPEQTGRAYHTECLKRAFHSTDDDVFYLMVQTQASMVDVARIESRRIEQPQYEIIVDGISGGIASVRLYSPGWIDYLHVVKARGEWKLLHAAYTEGSDRKNEASAEEEAEIRARVLDYIEAWYAGDAERHANAYHQECVKRAYAEDGHRLDWTSPERMVELCASGGQVLEGAEWEIIIDDVADDVATVRVYSTQWVDFLHLAKARGRWGLFHVVYHEQ